MNFQHLLKIENSKFYIDTAFRAANDKAKSARQEIKGQRSVVEKSKTVELAKIESVSRFLNKSLNKILENFPRIIDLNDFYRELLGCYVDISELRKSLGAVGWASDKVGHFYREYNVKIKRTKELKKINEYRRMFYGRAASAVRQVDKHLKIIDEARRIMKNFPSIKENIFTVAITGFPNVGKSTLLNKLTGANAEVASYAFTTKSLNLGYIFEEGKRAVQLIDTPGSLNRFEKMNNIEKQAVLAMKYCANIIVYIFDPTETYPIEDQVKLYDETKELEKEIIIYVSKTDIAEIPEKIKKLKLISSIEDVKREILELKKSS